MSLVDKLLQLDAAKIKMPEKEVEMKRLSKLLGEKVVFKIRAIDGQRYADIQRLAIDISNKGNVKDIDMYKLQVLTIIEGVVDPNLKDKRLLEHFNCTTPEELVKKLLLAGEITDLYNEITALSGYEVEVEDIKN
ncbi:phage tail assembly chaperone [Caldanaerobacter subterraneus]|uniref:XkdN-like protein n=1 Tax=Caldanaerobacter subterraneus TaxID=911092 RepID=A0A7Y2PM55_9THEO|nr:XkdN-like protein [Caldanaerobacter subterraneus]NNG67345.1 XkdN-like protein [Caldanaerobacter subterraneus]